MAGIKDLRGANIIVTGASGAIGSATARALATRGAKLLLADLQQDAIAPLVAECEAAGASSAQAIACDVTSDNDRRRLIAAGQPLDVLINVAGIGFAAPLGDLSSSQVSATLAVNLDAPIQLTKLALPPMIARKRGAIIQLCSLSGKLGMPYFQTYAASKAGLIFFAKSMRHELAGTGVHMAAVSPGFVRDAGMWADLEQKVPAIIGEVPPHRVADAIVKAIRGREDVLVTAGPTRPLIALSELSPGLGAILLRTLGFVRILKEAASRHNQGEDRQPEASPKGP